jgi:hypothetical protein
LVLAGVGKVSRLATDVLPVSAACCTTGATWKIITDGTPQPEGIEPVSVNATHGD